MLQQDDVHILVYTCNTLQIAAKVSFAAIDASVVLPGKHPLWSDAGQCTAVETH